MRNASWMGLLVVVALSGGCATVRTRAAQPADASAALAGAVRVCAWGNGPACDDLEQRLSELGFAASRAQSATLAGLVRDAAARPDPFSSTVQRCRAGESRPCDDAAMALAHVAAGRGAGDPLAQALLDTVEPAPAATHPGVLTAR